MSLGRSRFYADHRAEFGETPLKIDRPTYGLPGASIAWIRHSEKELKKLGWGNTVQVPCLYTLRRGDASPEIQQVLSNYAPEEIAGVLIAHAGDYTIGGESKVGAEKIANQIHMKLGFGSEPRIARKQEITFCGKQIEATGGSEGEPLSTLVHLGRKVNALNYAAIPKNEQEPLCGAAQTPFRSVKASLRFVTEWGNSVAYLQKIGSKGAEEKEKGGGLRILNQVVKGLKTAPRAGTRIAGIGTTRLPEMAVICLEDASFSGAKQVLTWGDLLRKGYPIAAYAIALCLRRDIERLLGAAITKDGAEGALRFKMATQFIETKVAVVEEGSHCGHRTLQR